MRRPFPSRIAIVKTGSSAAPGQAISGTAKHLRALGFAFSLCENRWGPSDVPMFSLFLAALAQAAPAAPAVSVERIADDAFAMSIAAPADIRVAELQQRLLPSARLACQARRPLFARYQIREGALQQELLCLDAEITPTPAAATLDVEWAPTPGDQQGLLAATYAYFAAKDAARYADAYGFLSDRMQSATPLSAWTEAARDFNAAAGPALGRRIVEISWYNHPSDAPEPGIYVAADYSAEFDKLEFVCGYVMWRLMPDGSLKLVREEQNFARKRGAKPMAAIDRDPLRARLGCKD